MGQDNHLDFTGQRFFVGIDVHKKGWKVTIRHNKMEIKTFSMNPSPDELKSYMHKHYPGASYQSAYEAGYCGFWIHRGLTQLGFNNIVIHPADVPTSHKEKVTKTDKIDSRKIARELESSNLRGIYIPDEFHQELRSLCRLRYREVQNLTRVKNRIKGHLNFYGIPIPPQGELSHWSANFIRWLETIRFPHDPAKDYLRLCLEELQQNRTRILEITRLLRKYCKAEPIGQKIHLLRSVVGVGFVFAVTFYSEIIEMDRFPTFLPVPACLRLPVRARTQTGASHRQARQTGDHLSSYVGLVPYLRSSGDRESDLGITNRRNQYLRHLIIEAAWVAVVKDPALLLAFSNLTLRMKKQDAIVRIARKLLNRMRYVWKNERPYVISTT